MDADHARKLAEAVQTELDQLPVVVVVDRENWDPGGDDDMDVSLELSTCKWKRMLSNSISLAKALSGENATATVNVPVVDVGTDGFIDVLADKVDAILATATVEFKVDIDDLVHSFETSVDEPDELNGFCLDLEVSVGEDDGNEFDEEPDMQTLFPMDALQRIKESIDWTD